MLLPLTTTLPDMDTVTIMNRCMSAVTWAKLWSLLPLTAMEPLPTTLLPLTDLTTLLPTMLLPLTTTLPDLDTVITMNRCMSAGTWARLWLLLPLTAMEPLPTTLLPLMDPTMLLPTTLPDMDTVITMNRCMLAATWVRLWSLLLLMVMEPLPTTLLSIMLLPFPTTVDIDMVNQSKTDFYE